MEKRKEEIEAEVARRIEEVKKEMEKEMMEEMERRRKQLLEEEKRREVRKIPICNVSFSTLFCFLSFFLFPRLSFPFLGGRFCL